MVKVRIKHMKEEHDVELDEGAKVADALMEAGITINSVIPRRDGTVITEEDEVRDGDVIDAIRIVSGG